MRRAISVILLAAAVCSLCACGLSGRNAEEILWPGLSGPYVRTTRDWTRQEVVYDGVNMEFTATATLKAMPWREAFTDKSAEVYSLSAAEKEKLLFDQRAAHARGADFVLALESPRYGNEKLSLDSQRWKVFAFQGVNRLYPSEIRVMDRRLWPDTKLKAFFPYYTRWQTFYSLHFDALAPGPVTLVVSGPAGVVNMEWERFE
ncbi:LptM family lipoprotein [Desulfocurvus sp. DL9XJH121]